MSRTRLERIAAAMRFEGPEPPEGFDESWLAVLDEQQITLLFGSVCREQLSPAVRECIDQRFAANQIRLAKLRAEYEAVARAVGEHVLLKGFSHGEEFLPDPALRPHYDLDLWVADPAAAFEAVRRLGYEPALGRDDPLTDHLPPLVRKTGWSWRGDFFDPDIPPIVEIHHRLWDAQTEAIPVPGLEQYWTRREGSRLAEWDRFGYAALHALRHLLRGSLKLLHAYELAYFLQHSRDGELWRRWRELHPPEMRRAEAVAARLCAGWFHAGLPEALEREAAALPAPVSTWFEHYGDGPRDDKSEVWLHLELTEGFGAKARILRRRFFPLRPPGALEGHYGAQAPGRSRRRRYLSFLFGRLLHHARTLLASAPRGAAWLILRRG